MSGAEQQKKREQGEKEKTKADVKSVFGANLTSLRKAAGLSQEALADRARLHRTHVGYLEKGRRQPELDTIYRLAGALGVSPGKLLAGIYWVPVDDGFGHTTDSLPQP